MSHMGAQPHMQWKHILSRVMEVDKISARACEAREKIKFRIISAILSRSCILK